MWLIQSINEYNTKCVCRCRKAGSKLVRKMWLFGLLVFLRLSTSLQLLQTILEGKDTTQQ